MLAPDENVVFDPRTCSKMRKLKVLNTAKNQMIDLKPLDLLTKLTELNISNNLLKDLPSVIQIIARLPNLQVNDCHFQQLAKAIVTLQLTKIFAYNNFLPTRLP